MGFDYRTAWLEHWYPAFQALSDNQRQFLINVCNDSDLSQDTGQGGNLNALVLNERAKYWIKQLEFQRWGRDRLVELGRIAYYYAHHYPYSALKQMGFGPHDKLAAGWRMSKLVYSYCADKGYDTAGICREMEGSSQLDTDYYNVSDDLEQHRHAVRAHAYQMEQYAAQYAELAETDAVAAEALAEPAPPVLPPPSDDQSLFEHIRDIFPEGFGLRPVKVGSINHRLRDGVQPVRSCPPRGQETVDMRHHPFCIGRKHLENSKGPYLDPKSAPCEICGCDYGEHTSEKALFVERHSSVTEELLIPAIQHAIKEINTQLTAWGIEGYAFPTGQDVPEPAVDLSALQPLESHERDT